MKRYLTGTLLFILALGLAAPTFARGSLYDLGKQQMRRIQQGIHSGELTRKEAKTLRREQRNIRRLKKRFVRDGRISRHERRTLKRRYVRADRRIYRLKHNHRVRYAYEYGPYPSIYDGGYGMFRFSFGRRF